MLGEQEIDNESAAPVEAPRQLKQPKPVNGPVNIEHVSKRRRPASPISLIDAVRNHRFHENVCFLCGAQLRTKSHDEHVFPKWLQNRYGLFNQTLQLLNGTTIPYRQLKIPCCKTCNNEYLSKIENTVQLAFDSGFSYFNRLDRTTLFLWINKIFFGLLYRERFLPVDRRVPAKGAILNHLEPFQLVHYFIQALRIPMTFQSADAAFPGTLFLFRLQVPMEATAQFDFRDDVEHRCIYMRLGEIGILAAFDAGAQAVGWKHVFARYSKLKLHPLQFEELGAHFFYNARLFDRDPTTVFADSGPNSRAFVAVGPIAGMSRRPVFSAGNPSDFARMLSEFVSVPLDLLKPNDHQVMTFLHRPDGTFRRLDLRKIPYRGVH